MQGPTRREPAVAGWFYPADPTELRSEVEELLGGEEPDLEPRLALVPHAGYVYSGAIAATVYRRLVLPRVVVLLGPNHHGVGRPFALPRSGAWRTPLGEVALAPESETIAARSSLFSDDWRAHAKDHALEVQLPFLQVLAERQGRELSLMTLSVGTHDPDALAEAGEALADGLVEAGLTTPQDVLLLVSSDMSHHISSERARALDLPALEPLIAGEAQGFFDRIANHGVTACGVAPATVALHAARRLGLRPGELLRYGHSGEVTGDDDRVVAYAAAWLPAA
ncbi:MAG: AmmeMemoRadiSam system protein B [Acidobacteriota bacterium]